MDGWRRSADRTRLQVISLLTGIFLRKLREIGLFREHIQKSPMNWALLTEFRKFHNSEISNGISEFICDMREWFDSSQARVDYHILA